MSYILNLTSFQTGNPSILIISKALVLGHGPDFSLYSKLIFPSALLELTDKFRILLVTMVM